MSARREEETVFVVEVRKPSGEWRTFGEYRDAREAEAIAYRLLQMTLDVRVEAIQRCIP